MTHSIALHILTMEAITTTTHQVTITDITMDIRMATILEKSIANLKTEVAEIL